MKQQGDDLEVLRRGAADGELRLRPTLVADSELLTRWFTDPSIAIPWAGLAELPAGQIRGMCERLSRSGGSFVLELGAEPVGYLAYDSSLGDAYVHIALASDARGRGLGSRALRLLADLLFAGLDVNCVYAAPAPDNAALLQALRKAGFVQPDPGRCLFERRRPD
jgi:RimJ/RimL family protein N-acetyltransferase